MVYLYSCWICLLFKQAWAIAAILQPMKQVQILRAPSQNISVFSDCLPPQSEGCLAHGEAAMTVASLVQINMVVTKLVQPHQVWCGFLRLLTYLVNGALVFILCFTVVQSKSHFNFCTFPLWTGWDGLFSEGHLVFSGWQLERKLIHLKPSGVGAGWERWSSLLSCILSLHAGVCLWIQHQWIWHNARTV